MTLYYVKGKLEIELHCDCPHCAGDEYVDGDVVGQEIEAGSAQEAIAKAVRDIIAQMDHNDCVVKFAKASATELAQDVILQRLGATPLFPLETVPKAKVRNIVDP